MKYFWIALGAALIILVAVIFGLPKRPFEPTSESGRLKVAATMFPLYDIVREVGGDYVDAKLIVPPGASPHFFEFTPRQLQELQDTRLLFEIGHGVDAWISRIENVAPGAQRITVDKGIQLRKAAANKDDEGDEEHEENSDGIDPHYWLHLGNARIMASTVADSLAAADPAHAGVYQENVRDYQEKLAVKEQELLALLAPLRGEKILTLHDAWYYFSDNFGLEVVGTFEPAVGGEPTPRYLENLRKQIKAYGISVVFFEPQLITPSLSHFAQDEGLRLALIDEVGGVEGRMTYLELMDYNARAVLEAFRGAP